jgi:hypothetical protein
VVQTGIARVAKPSRESAAASERGQTLGGLCEALRACGDDPRTRNSAGWSLGNDARVQSLRPSQPPTGASRGGGVRSRMRFDCRKMPDHGRVSRPVAEKMGEIRLVSMAGRAAGPTATSSVGGIVGSRRHLLSGGLMISLEWVERVPGTYSRPIPKSSIRDQVNPIEAVGQ